jgi:hypothetical protein
MLAVWEEEAQFAPRTEGAVAGEVDNEDIVGDPGESPEFQRDFLSVRMVEPVFDAIIRPPAKAWVDQCRAHAMQALYHRRYSGEFLIMVNRSAHEDGE